MGPSHGRAAPVLVGGISSVAAGEDILAWRTEIDGGCPVARPIRELVVPGCGCHGNNVVEIEACWIKRICGVVDRAISAGSHEDDARVSGALNCVTQRRRDLPV